MHDFFRVAGFAALALITVGPTTETLRAAPLAEITLPGAIDSLPPSSVMNAPASPILPKDTADKPMSGEPSLTSLTHAMAQAAPADDQENCLATAVYFEAKGEPLDGQLAVAKVIMNRAKSGRFADTVCGVVMQHGQFSFVRHGTLPAIGRGNANWRIAVGIAHVALNDLWQPTAANALYFHAKRVAPSWRMTRIASIGNHVFYR